MRGENIQLIKKNKAMKTEPNDFQKWLFSMGYYRESGAWFKDGVLVSGKELSDKLNEWKSLTTK